MCGIAGVLARRPLDLADRVRSMAGALRHRGPDDAGVWVDEDAGIALGHRRLAILDVSRNGAQPMVSASGRYVTVFNGEIYNFSQLRRELDCGAGAPPRWRGHSDTEVLLAALETWGLQRSLERFVGMFAFAVWDRARRTLSLARDRMGEKPLYYGDLEPGFVFGSELGAFRAAFPDQLRVSRPALDRMLTRLYVPAPLSIYEGVFKLEPGRFLTLEPGKGWRCRTETYWSAHAAFEAGARNPFPGDEEEAADRLEDHLRQAVRGQMVSDVPIGAFLSGGIDSSLAVALMQAESSRPVRTFSIGFHHGDEAPFARAVAKHLGTRHEERYVGPEEVLGVLPDLPSVHDEPFADPSQIPMLVIARLAREHVTVCLSGDGGDELFGGYPKYRVAQRLYRRLDRVPRSGRVMASEVLRIAASPRLWHLLALADPGRPRVFRDRIAGLADRIAMTDPGDLARLMARSSWLGVGSPVLHPDAPAAPPPGAGGELRFGSVAERMMYNDAVRFLPDDILVKVDRATMSVGLESRTPYLDHRVVEFAARLPLEMKLREHEGKLLLREVLARHLPREWFDRPKQGFGPPLRPWLVGPLRPWVEELLDEARLRREGFLDAGIVSRIWRAFLRGESYWTVRLWAILMFQAWLEQDQELRSAASVLDRSHGSASGSRREGSEAALA